jgi:hypothetical protein
VIVLLLPEMYIDLTSWIAATPEICSYGAVDAVDVVDAVGAVGAVGVVDAVDDVDAPWEHVADEGWRTSVWVLLGGGWQTSAHARVGRDAFLLENYLNKIHRWEELANDHCCTH